MNTRLLHIALVASGMVSASAVSRGHGAVIYRETFGRPDPATGNIGTNVFDWQRWNAAGTSASQTSGVSSSGTGIPTDVANTPSAGPNSDGTFNAYAEGWSFQDGTQRLTMTPEFSFNPADYEPGGVVLLGRKRRSV